MCEVRSWVLVVRGKKNRRETDETGASDVREEESNGIVTPFLLADISAKPRRWSVLMLIGRSVCRHSNSNVSLLHICGRMQSIYMAQATIRLTLTRQVQVGYSIHWLSRWRRFMSTIRSTKGFGCNLREPVSQIIQLASEIRVVRVSIWKIKNVSFIWPCAGKKNGRERLCRPWSMTTPRRR